MSPRPRHQAPTYRAAHKLKGKVTLITGGNSGIGRAFAIETKRAVEARAYVTFASNADRSYITGEVLTLPGGERRAA